MVALFTLISSSLTSLILSTNLCYIVTTPMRSGRSRPKDLTTNFLSARWSEALSSCIIWCSISTRREFQTITTKRCLRTVAASLWEPSKCSVLRIMLVPKAKVNNDELGAFGLPEQGDGPHESWTRATIGNVSKMYRIQNIWHDTDNVKYNSWWNEKSATIVQITSWANLEKFWKVANLSQCSESESRFC